MSLAGSREGCELLQAGDENSCVVLTTRISAVTPRFPTGAGHQLLRFSSIVKMGNLAVGYCPVACKCQVGFFVEASGVERCPMAKGCLQPALCVQLPCLP